MAKLLKECPKCGGGVRTVWANGRKLRQECTGPEDEDEYCEWEGEPWIPKKKPVKAVKTVHVGSWCYEGFDGRGHTFVHSEGFGSEKACTDAARKEMRRMSKFPDMGKCRAVVWPPTTTVKGKLVG